MKTHPKRPLWQRISGLFVDADVCESAYAELAVEVLEAREMLSADITGLTLLTDSGISNDGYTTTPIVVASVNNSANGSSLSLHVDADNDGQSDYSRELGVFGAGTHNFQFDSSSFHLTDKFGQQNLSFRVVSQSGKLGTVASAWRSFSYNWVNELQQLHFAATALLELGNRQEGAPVATSAIGTGYLLFSEQTTQSRFGFSSTDAAQLFAARFDAASNKWFVNNGTTWTEFATRETDRVIARLNFGSQSTVVLPDSTKVIGGLKAGVVSHTLDITFTTARNSAVTRIGVKGAAIVSLVSAAKHVETISFGNLRNGIAMADDTAGIGYFMYSATDLAVRFSANPPSANTAAQVIGVRYNGKLNHWEYCDGTNWHQFQVQATDRLLAIVDLDAKITRLLTGEVGEVFGIKQGFSDSDISIVSNQFGGQSSAGDYQIFGSYARMRPSIADSQPTFDFGNVSRGSNLTRTLSLKNVFDYAVEVREISLPYGFSATEFVPGVLLPGQSMSIAIRLDGLFSGDASGAIGIKTIANQVESVQTLELKAQITSPAIALEYAGKTIASEVDWGVLTAGQTVSREITVRNTGVGVLSLGDVLVPNGFIVTSPLSSKSLNAGQTAKFTVSFTGGSVPLNSGLLQVMPSVGGLPLQILNLTAEVDVPRLSVRVGDGSWSNSFERISFGTVVAGQTLSRTLTLQNFGVTPLDINSIDVPAGISVTGFRSKVTLQAGQTLSLQVLFSPSAGAQVNGSLLINSNDPNDAKFQIDIAGVAILPSVPKLLNDHGPIDGRSNDPRIFIALSPKEFVLPNGIVRAHIDSNDDGAADDILSVTSTNFVYDPKLTADGSFQRRVRFEIIDPVSNNSVYTSWQAFAATLDSSIVDQPARILSVALAGDNVSDKSMMSAAIEGVVANDGSFHDVVVQIDFDGDEVIDAVTNVRPDGTFRFEAFGQPLGSHLWVVTLREFPYRAQPRTSAPVGVEFNLIPYPAPTFVSFGLKQDTGTSNTDRITSQPFVKGKLGVTGDSERYRVYWDSESNGDFENWAVVNSNGEFEVDFSSLGVGHHTVYLKSFDLDKNVGSPSVSLKVQLTTIETPSIASFSLVRGVNASGVTDDVALKGNITSEWGVDNRQLQFDIDGDGFVDQVVYSDSNGNFQYAPRTLNFGKHTVRVRAVAFDRLTETDVVGEWSSISFEYQKSLGATITEFQVANSNASNQVVEPLISGKVSANGTAGRYAEVEFDYDGDGVADAYTVTDFFGNFTHFADTKVGVESTVRARVRSVDAYNSQHVFGSYQQIKFTRVAGQPRLATAEFADMTAASQNHSARVWSALNLAVNGLRGQFNGSGIGGDMGSQQGGGGAGTGGGGFNVAGVSLALATANQSFGVTPVEKFSFQEGQESRHILAGNAAQGTSANSGSYSFTSNNGIFAVAASMTFEVVVNASGTRNFSYTMNFSLTSGTESILGGAAGSFSRSLLGGIEFSETLFLQGNISADNYYFTTNYLSSISISGGSVDSNGSVSYTLSRSETVNNTAGFSRADVYGNVIATAKQSGTYIETIVATNVGSTGGAVQKTFDRDFRTELESRETFNKLHAADGFNGTEARSRIDFYKIERKETGGMLRADEFWTVGETLFRNNWSTSSNVAASINGTFFDPLGYQSHLIGALSPDSARQNNPTTYTVSANGSRVDTVSNNIAGSYNLQFGTTATFNWVSDSKATLLLNLTTNSPPNVDGLLVTRTNAALTYRLETDDDISLSGNFGELGTTVTVSGTGNMKSNSKLHIHSNSLTTTTSPTLNSSSSRDQTIDSTNDSSNSYNFSSATPDHTGNYSLTQTTKAIVKLDEEVRYNSHRQQTDVHYQRQAATLNGSVKSTMTVNADSVQSESGDYAVTGGVTTTTGTFDKKFDEASNSKSASDMTVVTDAGNYESVKSKSSQDTTSNQTDKGTFSAVDHFDPTRSSRTTNGNFNNKSNTTGSSELKTDSYELIVIQGYPVTVTRLESYKTDTTTAFSSSSTENGSYSELNSLLNNYRTGSGSHSDASNSNSTTKFEQTRAAGPWVITTTNTVTTQSNSTGGGTYSESASSITYDDRFESKSNSTGSGSTTVTQFGDGYGSTAVTSSNYSSSGSDKGTVTGTRAKQGAASNAPLIKSGSFTLASSEQSTSYYHDYSRRSGVGLSFSSESVTNVSSNSSMSETGTYIRGAEGVMTRNGNFDSAVSSQTTELSLFSLSSYSGRMPVFESESSPPSDTIGDSLYTAFYSTQSLTTDNNSRNTKGTTTTVTQVSGAEVETAQGTFDQKYAGSVFSISNSGTFIYFAQGSAAIESASYSSGSTTANDTNGTFNDNGTVTTESYKRTKQSQEGGAETTKSFYTVRSHAGRETSDSTERTRTNSGYFESADITERVLASGVRENVSKVGNFRESSNQAVTEDETKTVSTTLKVGLALTEAEGQEFSHDSLLSVITSNEVTETRERMRSNRFTSGTFNNVGDGFDRTGTYSSSSSLLNSVTAFESGTGVTPLIGSVLFNSYSSSVSSLFDAENNGRFRSTSIPEASTMSHEVLMKSSGFKSVFQFGLPAGDAENGIFAYSLNSSEESDRDGTISDDSKKYRENTRTINSSSESSYWYEFKKRPRNAFENFTGSFAAGINGIFSELFTQLNGWDGNGPEWWNVERGTNQSGWQLTAQVENTQTVNTKSESEVKRQTSERSRLGGAIASQSHGGSGDVKPTYYIKSDSSYDGFRIARQEAGYNDSLAINTVSGSGYLRKNVSGLAGKYEQQSETIKQTLGYEAAGFGDGASPRFANYSKYEIDRSSKRQGRSGAIGRYMLRRASGNSGDADKLGRDYYFGAEFVANGVTDSLEVGWMIVHRNAIFDDYRTEEHIENFRMNTAPPDDANAPAGWDGRDYGRSRRIDQTWAEAGRTWRNTEYFIFDTEDKMTLWRSPTIESDLYYKHKFDLYSHHRSRSTTDNINKEYKSLITTRLIHKELYVDSSKNVNIDAGPKTSTPTGTKSAEHLFALRDNREWVLDRLSDALDVISVVADVLTAGLLGGVFDLMNAGLSYSRGRYGEMALNLAAAIPFIGYAATTAKYAGKATNAIGDVSKHIGNVSEMTKMSKGLGNTAKTAGKTLESGAQAAKRSGDASGAAKRSNASKKHQERNNCPDPENRQCFIGDTKVLIFTQVPEEIIAAWAPVPLDLVQARSRNVLGMWFSLSAAGVVVAIGLRAARVKDDEDASSNRQQRMRRCHGGSNSNGADSEENDGNMMIDTREGHTIDLDSAANGKRIELPTVPPQVTAEDLAQWAQADLSQLLAHEYWDGQSLARVVSPEFRLTHISLPVPLPVPISSNSVVPVSSLENRTQSLATNESVAATATVSTFSLRSLPISEIMSQAQRLVPTRDPQATEVRLAPPIEPASQRSRWRLILDWPHWTAAMWISLLLCLGTWIGFAWFDAPPNTAIRPAGELGSREVVDRPAAMFQHLQLGQSKHGMMLAQVPIRDIKIGTRAPAFNPEVTAAERASWVEPRWEEWLWLSLLMPKEDGTNLEIEILRPESWVVQQFQFHYEEPASIPSRLSLAEPYQISSASVLGDELEFEFFPRGTFSDLSRYLADTDSAADGQHADSSSSLQLVLPPLRPAYYEVAMAGLLAEIAGVELLGATVEMDLPELGAVGPAFVVDLRPCPAIPTGPGQVITATFKHASADVIDLVLSDSPLPTPHSALPTPHSEISSSPDTLSSSPIETIGVTGNHPFWSLDRLEFVQVGELAIGERLQTLAGDTKWVQQKLPRPGPEPVYNLEIHGEHVYYVGTNGILAHNASCGPKGRYSTEASRKMGISTSSQKTNPSIGYVIYNRDGSVYKFGVSDAAGKRLSQSLKEAPKGATYKTTTKMEKREAHLWEKYMVTLHYNSTGIKLPPGMKYPRPVE